MGSAPLTWQTDPLSHVVSRLVHAIQMVADLIPHTDRSGLPRVVEIACLEDWFTNYRLVIEFLILRPPRNCVGARDLLPGWTPTTTREVQRMREDYGWASEHVAHIGQPKATALVENVAPPLLAIKANFLLDVVEEFASALEAANHNYSTIVRVGLSQARDSIASM